MARYSQIGTAAADLCNVIDIERDTVTRVNGVESRTPAYFAQGVWAQVKAISGREQYQEQQVSAVVDWEFTLRYRTDILPSDRIVFGGRRYEIRSVLPDFAAHDYVVLECKGL